jgi:CubicO group peptidase (beta-lactamase class C family)
VLQHGAAQLVMSARLTTWRCGSGFLARSVARSTFDLAAVRADGDYAPPHAADLSGDLRPIHLRVEQDVLAPVRPAGGLWSTALEMARFVQTELASDVAPSGRRVVSAANLTATWTPRVAVPNLYGGPPEMTASMSHYGLGWLNGKYRGVRVTSHAGGTTGLYGSGRLPLR